MKKCFYDGRGCVGAGRCKDYQDNKYCVKEERERAERAKLLVVPGGTRVKVVTYDPPLNVGMGETVEQALARSPGTIRHTAFPRQTHTYVELEISNASHEEIAGKLRAAGYHHCFVDGEDDPIVLQGVALVRKVPGEPLGAEAPAWQWLGCCECDCEFACYEGKARCIRLPREPHRL